MKIHWLFILRTLFCFLTLFHMKFFQLMTTDLSILRCFLWIHDSQKACALFTLLPLGTELTLPKQSPWGEGASFHASSSHPLPPQIYYWAGIAPYTAEPAQLPMARLFRVLRAIEKDSSGDRVIPAPPLYWHPRLVPLLPCHVAVMPLLLPFTTKLISVKHLGAVLMSTAKPMKTWIILPSG